MVTLLVATIELTAVTAEVADTVGTADTVVVGVAQVEAGPGVVVVDGWDNDCCC